MPASVAGISYSSARLRSGIASARGHGAPCYCFSRSSAVRHASLGSVANLCLPRFCTRKVAPSCTKRGARVQNTLTTDVYQQDEHDIAQSRKQEHESGIDLKQWMHEQGLPQCKVALAEHQPWENDKGRPIHYVVASQDLQPGEVAIAVPKSLVVTLEKVLGDETIAELLTTNKLSELACLALYLMYEKKQGKDSYWYPYIRELDRQRGRGQLAVESPLLWSREELNEYFTGSPMKEVVLERLAGIKREYEELDTVWFMAGSLFKQYPFDLPTEAFSFEIFKQAFVAVQSCVVHLQGVSLARRFALVPLGPPLLAYKSNCKAMLKAVGDYVQLEVDCAYKAGAPISVWCGPQPNSRLLLNYGFVDEDNPYDRLAVEASLEMDDPLYQQKRSIVQKNNRLTVQTFQVNVSSVLDLIFFPGERCPEGGEVVEIDDVPVLNVVFHGKLGKASPTSPRRIIEPPVGSNEFKSPRSPLLEIYKGKEMEAVLDMLPYMRLAHLSDPAEMEFVSFAQGPVCPVSACNERAVLDQLLRYFQRRLSGYRRSDTTEVSDAKKNAKKRVAEKLLCIEKDILGKALAAVEELISHLPDGAVSPCIGPYLPHLK